MGKAEETRKFIIETVAPIFNMHGYEGTALSQLTEATGLTKGALYGNFKNKQEIALAALEYNISRIRSEISDTVGPIRNSCDKLAVFAVFYRNMFDEISRRGGCPILNAAIDSDDTELPLHGFVIRSIDQWMGMLILIVTRGIKRGEIKKDIDPEAFATLFISLIEGGIMLSKATGARMHLERNVAYLIDKINADLRI
ncbi:MAG: TetR/AcrR family transcriptional regulator [Syntrophales bacterium]|jgi:AcrR family transcriptional regulator